MIKRFIAGCLIVFFMASLIVGPQRGYAQEPLNLPAPGTMINLSPVFPPVLIKGLKVHPENPLLFDFILDTGKSGLKVNSQEFKNESQKLIKYFLASLTIKEDDLWVNLSPYEKDRIIPDALGQTELGRDMLAQDYILKQLTASLIYPEKKLGKEFWNRVYEKSRQMFGVSQIPVNTFNKVWIVADKAKVLERNNTGYIVGAHLKVMLEEDYLAMEKHSVIASEAKQSFNKIATSPSAPRNDTSTLASQIIRSIILPALEQEVNQGQNFSTLRQMFYSMILASWYKLALKEALLNQVYSNRAKTGGVLSDDPSVKEKIFQQYLKAYKKGVFNFIKEESIPPLDGEPASPQGGGKGGVTLRKYFSGGLQVNIPRVLETESVVSSGDKTAPDGDMAMVTVHVRQLAEELHPSEDGIKTLGRALYERGKKQWWKRFKRMVSPSERLIRLTNSQKYPKTKKGVLELTAKMPMIQDNNDAIFTNVAEGLGGSDIHPLISLPVRAAAALVPRLPGEKTRRALKTAVAIVAKGVIEKVMAKRFLIGDDINEAVAKRNELELKGYGVTFDFLGDESVSSRDAQRYLEMYMKMMEVGIDDVSVKISNFFAEFNPNDWKHSKEPVKKALKQLINKANQIMARNPERHIAITFDMEYLTYKDLTIEVYLELLKETHFPNLMIALQAYLKETMEDVKRINATVEEINATRSIHSHIRAGIRLVKGANWDYDLAHALYHGQDIVHYTNKFETDINYESIAVYMLQHTKNIRPAFGTHNVRSMAVIMQAAEELDLSKQAFEFQYLYGMVPDEIVSTIRDMGYKVRFYAPFGDKIAATGYLGRRANENGTQNGALNNFSYDPKGIEQALESPRVLLEKSKEPHLVWPTVKLSVLEKKAWARLEKIEASLESRPKADFAKKMVPIVWRYLNQMRDLLQSSQDIVESTPGEFNEYIYIPRGAGVVVIEDENLTAQEIIERVVAPIIAGNSIVVSMPEGLNRSLLKEFLRDLELGQEVQFVSIDDALEVVAARDVVWVSFTGSRPSAKRLRQRMYARLRGQPVVKKFITGVRTKYIIDFLKGKSISERLTVVDVAAWNREGGEPFKPRRGLKGFANHPAPELYRLRVQERLQKAVDDVPQKFPADKVRYPIIDNQEVRTPAVEANIVDSLNPADPREVVARVAFAGEDEAKLAVKAARQALPQWSAMSVKERSEILLKVADIASKREFDLAGLMVHEVSKPQAEALGDIEEGIDFIRYYALAAQKLSEGEFDVFNEYLGEEFKQMVQSPHGVAAVIAPWNFPFAILVGMASAALITGNTVVLKPSEQTSGIADEFMKMMMEAGIPPGVLNFLPGTGAAVGEALVKDPDVDAIYFTGSQNTGLRIKRLAEKVERPDRPAKVVSAEMGGKNATIITSSANLDAAVKGTIKAGFSFSGQKCSAGSRIIVLRSVAEAFIAKFSDKFKSIPAGDPRKNASAVIVPLYDPKGVDKVNEYVEIAKTERNMGTLLLASRNPGAEPGNNPSGFWAPANVYLVEHPEKSRLAKEEIFGPVVTIMVVDTLQEAVALANDTPYGLVAGVYSQTPSEVEYFIEHIQAGNVYVNREITGAMVNRHPFGGEGMSGQGGEKTGGPDSLNIYTKLESAFTTDRAMSFGGIDSIEKRLRESLAPNPRGLQKIPSIEIWDGKTPLSKVLTDPQGRQVIALFGEPDDTGTVKNMGRPGDNEPDAVFREIFDQLRDDEAFSSLKVIYIGNVILPRGKKGLHPEIRPGEETLQGLSGGKRYFDNIDENYDRVKRTVAALLQINPEIKLGVIGGDNGYSYPTFYPFKGRKGLVALDNHLDARSLRSGRGNPRLSGSHSGNYVTNGLENGNPEGLLDPRAVWILGADTATQYYGDRRRYLVHQKMVPADHIVRVEDVHRMGTIEWPRYLQRVMRQVRQRTRNFHAMLDIDTADISHFPGRSAKANGKGSLLEQNKGLSGEAIIAFAYAAGAGGAYNRILSAV